MQQKLLGPPEVVARVAGLVLVFGTVVFALRAVALRTTRCQKADGMDARLWSVLLQPL